MSTPAPIPDDDPPAPPATRLLDVAERLFAEHGIVSVSTRRIVLAGGQGNLSAAHYHFGSRDALIRAVIARRQRTIDAIRHRRLDEVVERRRDDDVGAIVGAAVETLAEVVEHAPWGPDYVRVLAHAMFDPRMRLPDTLDPSVTGSLERTRGMIRRRLPGLTDEAFERRVLLVHHETSYAIARWVHAHGAVTDTNRHDYRALVRELVAFMAAGLQAAAPVPRLDEAGDAAPRTRRRPMAVRAARG